MSISVTGLGSGLDYDSWIEQLVAIKQSKIDAVSKQVTGINTQKTTLSGLEDNYTSLLTSIESFTKSYSTDNVFNKKSVTSSSEAVTALLGSDAVAQSVKVGVSQLATATRAQGVSAAASYIDLDTKLGAIAKGSIEAGSFSVYVGGAKTSINITTDETMQDLLDDLNAIDGVEATLSEDGKLTIGASGDDPVTANSSSDTSNFGNVMSLVKQGDGYASSKSIFDTDTSATLTSASFERGNVSTGKFKIGNAEFEIKTTTTLDDLIKEINNNKNAGVTASWNPNSGKLVLESTDEGAVNINVESAVSDGGSNFTYIMGLTTANGQSLITGSQELGTNAVLTINGTEITSTSNTVTSDISGIKGLTLTLNEETTTDAQISVVQDTKGMSDAITSFVSAFNMVILKTDTETGSSGYLRGESILTSLRNRLRSTVTESVDGEDGYKTLASIGITTGKVSTDTSTKTNQLVIDTDMLTKALAENPDAVKTLLTGDSDSKGVLNNLESILTGALDITKGYFVTREKSFDTQADRLDEKIASMTESLKEYQANLEAKFQAMDELIANLNNQASVFDSYFNKSSKDK